MTREEFYISRDLPEDYSRMDKNEKLIAETADDIYNDFQSRICENCKWYQTHTYQSALGTKETEVTVTRCQKHWINWGKDFGCVDFVRTDTESQTNKGE